MSTPKSFEESLGDWRQMLDSLASHFDEMPHLRPIHTALAALVARGLALQGERNVLQARLREVNHERHGAFAEGRRLRNRLVAGLQGTLGAKNERLIEFGVTPQPRIVHRNRPTAAERARRAAAAASMASEENTAPDGAGRQNDPPLVN